MAPVDVTAYPLDHPWRQLSIEDASEFLAKLANLNDRTIATIVASAQLQDTNLASKLSML